MNFTKTIINAIKYWVNSRLSNYVETVEGKGLSTEDYTSEEKEKLAGIEAGATKVVVDNELLAESANPVENKVVHAAFEELNEQIEPLASKDYVDSKEVSWDDLNNRPFGEEKVVIEWDGVIGDRVCATVPANPAEAIYIPFVKVSDIYIPPDTFSNARSVVWMNGSDNEPIVFDAFDDIDRKVVVEEDGWFARDLSVSQDCMLIASVSQDNAEVRVSGFEYGYVFPEAGTYFGALSEDGAGTNIAYQKKLEWTTFTQLDPQYIPDTIARTEDIPTDIIKTVNGIAADENGNVQIDVATDEEVIAMLLELDVLPTLVDSEGSLLIDSNGSIPV